ncbi:ABC transporter ATP-binding protein [Streptosporangium violaceochromogenes]|nr:ABC transporter ATP-binding protein [Streptosporangium violaceochromogenes]
MTSTSPPAVDVRGLSVRYGGFHALRDLSVNLPAGRIIGVIGPNGAGKTTLLNAISGFTHVTDGEILLDGRAIQGWDIRRRVRAGLVRGFQTVRLMERESVLTNVLVGAERLDQPNALAQLFALPAQWRGRRIQERAAHEVIELLGLGADRDRRVDELPFASRRLVEVARVLISYPPVILLDEPAAGLDQEGRRELAAVLARVHERHPSTLVVVEHDVDLVKNLCSHVVALESGAVVCAGTPDRVFGDPRVQLAYFGRSADAPA